MRGYVLNCWYSVMESRYNSLETIVRHTYADPGEKA